MTCSSIGRGALVLCSLAVLSCGKSEHKITIVFPSQALKEATSQVEVLVFRQASPTDHCPQLKLDEKIGEELENVFSKTVKFPFSPGDLSLGDLPDGTYPFVVVAWNRADTPERFMRGCLTVPLRARESLEVKVELAEFRGCCRTDDQRCINTNQIPCYDAPAATKTKGACKTGYSDCKDQYFTSCLGQVLPQPEVCNGRDDDCDGEVDNVPPDKLSSDPLNCGKCGRVCKQTCASGVCDQTIDAGPPIYDGRTEAAPRELGTDGRVGDGRVGDGPATPCTGSAQCKDPKKPICEAGLCRGCSQDVRCSDKDPATPHCHADGSCVACNSDGHCSGTAKFCVTNHCLECRTPGQGTDCSQTPKPMVCNLLNQCTETCSGPSACPPARPKCVGQICVECAQSADCPALRPICGFGGACVPCTVDIECPSHSASLPFCQQGVCVACKTSPHCKNPKPLCQAGACVACAADTQCQTRDPLTPFCVTGSWDPGCHECRDSSQCKDAKKPSCGGGGPFPPTASHTCGGCENYGMPQDDDCAAYHSATPVCDYNTGYCVECLTSQNHCTKDPKLPICENKVCRGCKTGAECLALDAKTPVCDPTGFCRGCKLGADCADPLKPVCNTDGSCRACNADADCAFICQVATGRCLAETDVIFANAATSCPGAGTLASPFCKLDSAIGALTAQKQMIMAQGTFTTSQLTFATQGGHLRPTKGSLGPIVIRGEPCPLITINGVKVTLESVSVTTTSGLAAGNGGGIAVTNSGTLTLLASKVGPGSCVGIDVVGVLDMQRTMVSYNAGGGVRITPIGAVGGSKIVNSFIVRNGSTISNLGGVLVNIGMMSWIDLSYSTVAYNTAKPSVVGGVVTGGGPGPGGGTMCVIWGNSFHQVSQYSEWDSSDIDDPDGTWFDCYGSCIRLDPQFKNTAADDFHLTAASPCVNAGPTTPPIKIDFDGDVRPQGPKADMGADELK